MPASTVSGTRSTLATALTTTLATVYASVPEAPIPPAIVIVPNSPYMETTLINDSTIKVKINFAISAIVANNSNAGALENLEALIMVILANIPAGYVVGDVEKPTVLIVGVTSMLAADINVSTYYTQTT